MRLKNRVVALGFDTFEGIPEAREGDRGLPYRAGDFCDVNLAALRDRLAAHNFSNFELVKGRFSDTLPQRTQFLREYTPVFISIDCDYYSSTIDVFDSLIPSGIAPHGCMFYFDDISINFYSEKTGEMRAITELNAGRYGSDICLVEHPLYIETGELRHYRQLWRLFNLREAEKAAAERSPDDRMQAVTLDRISPL